MVHISVGQNHIPIKLVWAEVRCISQRCVVKAMQAERVALLKTNRFLPLRFQHHSLCTSVPAADIFQVRGEAVPT